MDKRLGDPFGAITKKQRVQSLRRIGIIRRLYTDDDGVGDIDDFRIYAVDVDLSCGDRVRGCPGCGFCVGFDGPFWCKCGLQTNVIDKNMVVDPAVHLRLEFRPTLSKLCVVNSTVYVFDGYSGTIYEDSGDERFPGHSFDESNPIFSAKSISKYVLTEEILSGVNKQVVRESDLTKSCDMIYPKCLLRAVPSPNGENILVFSSFVSPGMVGCFELYDTGKESCRVLPPIPQVASPDEAQHPEAFTFLSDAIFFLETDSGRYIFDLDEWRWDLLGQPSIPWDVRRNGFEATEGGCVMNLDLVHYLPGAFRKPKNGIEKNWEEGGFGLVKPKRSTFPYSCRPEQQHVDQHMMVVDYNHKNQVCHVCTLRAYPDKIQVLIDLIRIYLPTADRPALVSTIIQSLKVDTNEPVDADALEVFSLCCL